MIVSILGTSGRNRDTKEFEESHYNVSSELHSLLKEGQFFNATHALVQNNQKEKFIFFGTHKSFEYQEEWLPEESDQYHRIVMENSDPEKIFNLFYEAITSSDENVVFDITHSFRDLVIMSVVATIVTRFVLQKQIDIIYARQSERERTYTFVQEQSLLDISEWTYLLTTFKSTFNIPPVATINDPFGIYKSLRNFSLDLMGNRISALLEKSYPTLVVKLRLARKTTLEPLRELTGEIIDELKVFDRIRIQKEGYKKLYYFAEAMHKKHYHLITLTYLHEAIPYYLHDRLKKEGMFTDKRMDYAFSGEVKKLLSNDNVLICCDKKITINGSIEPLRYLYNNIKEKRNNLAHLNPDYNYDVEAIDGYLNRFREIIFENDILKNVMLKIENNYQQKKMLKEIDKFWGSLGLNRNPFVIEELKERGPNYVHTPRKLRKAKFLNDKEFRRNIDLQYRVVVKKERLKEEERKLLMNLLRTAKYNR